MAWCFHWKKSVDINELEDKWQPSRVEHVKESVKEVVMYVQVV